MNKSEIDQRSRNLKMNVNSTIFEKIDYYINFDA